MSGGTFGRKGPRERWLQIRGLVHEKCSAAGLEAALQEFLGEARFSQALAHSLVPTYDLLSEDIHVFDSAQCTLDTGDDILMRHVVRGATAAPTYFDPFVIGPPISDHKRVLVDGGLYANNPSMLALLWSRGTTPTGTCSSSRSVRGARAPRRCQKTVRIGAGAVGEAAPFTSSPTAQTRPLIWNFSISSDRSATSGSRLIFPRNATSTTRRRRHSRI